MNLLKKLVKEHWIHGLAIVLFLAIPSVFFYPEFQGKLLSQDDLNEGPGQMAEFDYADNTIFNDSEKEDRPLWTSAMYIGQPSFFFVCCKTPIGPLHSYLQFRFDQQTGYFFLLAMGMYIVLISMGLNPILAVAGGVAMAMSTNNVVLYQAGHMMKIGSIMYGLFIIAGTYLLAHKQKYLIGLALYALGFAMSIYTHHIQMIYYIYISLVLFGFIYAYQFIKDKAYVRFSKVVAIVLLGSILGIAPNMAKLWTTYELSEETVRGPNIIEEVESSTEEATAGGGESSSGLDWEYAMQWSNNTLDVFSALVPRMVGGSSAERVRSGASFNALRRAGQGVEADGSMRLPLYWGDLPFTSGPTYFGAIMVFLFTLGAFLVKGKVKWWLVGSTAITIAISYGHNFEVFNRLLFEYAPLFNKFRTPMSVLSVTIIFITILGLLGLYRYLEDIRTKKEKAVAQSRLLWSAGITGGVCLAIAVLGPSLFSFSGPNDGNYQSSGLLQFLIEDRKSFMQQDAFRSLIFIMVAAVVLYLISLKKIPIKVGVGVVGVLILVDFWGVNRRYIHPSDYKYESGQERAEEYYTEREVDRQIYSLEDSRFDYRVLDLSINTFNTNYATYFHNTIGGYIATKLQRIQDIQDFHFTRLTRPVLDMLNTKYIINQNEELVINDQALGWSWFVEEVNYVETNRQEIEALYEFDPSATAVVKRDEFESYLEGQDYSVSSPTDRIERTEYLMDIWKYEYSTSNSRIAVFSEMWYKPEKGLKAYVNGEEVDFIRVNYMLRGLPVPPGKGEIEFRFDPLSVRLGSVVSSAGTWILYILLTLSFFYAVKAKIKD